jgi:hypothetical protein
VTALGGRIGKAPAGQDFQDPGLDHQLRAAGVGPADRAAAQAFQLRPGLGGRSPLDFQALHPVLDPFVHVDGHVDAAAVRREFVARPLHGGVQKTAAAVIVTHRLRRRIHFRTHERPLRRREKPERLRPEKSRQGFAVDRGVAAHPQVPDQHQRAFGDGEGDRRALPRPADLVFHADEGVAVALIGELHLEGGVVDVRAPLAAALEVGEFLGGRLAQRRGALAGIAMKDDLHGRRRRRGFGGGGGHDQQDHAQNETGGPGASCSRPAPAAGPGLNEDTLIKPHPPGWLCKEAKVKARASPAAKRTGRTPQRQRDAARRGDWAIYAAVTETGIQSAPPR